MAARRPERRVERRLAGASVRDDHCVHHLRPDHGRQRHRRSPGQPGTRRPEQPVGDQRGPGPADSGQSARRRTGRPLRCLRQAGRSRLLADDRLQRQQQDHLLDDHHLPARSADQPDRRPAHRRCGRAAADRRLHRRSAIRLELRAAHPVGAGAGSDGHPDRGRRCRADQFRGRYDLDDAAVQRHDPGAR